MDNQLASLILLQQQQLYRQEEENKELRKRNECFAPKMSLKHGTLLILDWNAVDGTFDIAKYLENGSPFEGLIGYTLCLCTNEASDHISLHYTECELETTPRPCLSIGGIYGDSVEVETTEMHAIEMLDRIQELFQEVYNHCDQGNTTIVNNFNEFCKRCEIARNAVRDFSK